MTSIHSRLFNKFRGGDARKNILYYISQIFMLASPVIVLPYLGRVVGPVGLGLYGSGQALALLVTTVVEFNLIQSGARQTAKIRHDPVLLRQLVASVFGAKLLLTLFSAVVCAILFSFVGIMHANMLVFGMALVFGLVQGHSIYWFFGGIGNLQFVALTDVIGRVVGVVAVFAFVHSAGQLWLVFLAQAVGGGIGVLVAIGFMASRFTGLVKPDFAGGLRLMQQNRQLFLQSLIGTIYTGSTALVMGLASTPAAIGYFSAAERMVRAGVLPTMPLRQTFFPSVVALVHEDLPRSVRLVRRLLYATGGFNFCVSLFLFFFSGPIIRIVFGPNFGLSVEVLQILAVLPLLLSFQDAFSNLWLIPLHHDRYVTFVVLVAGMIHVVGVTVLALFWGPIGAAVAMLASNIVACSLVAGKSLSLPVHPFSRQ